MTKILKTLAMGLCFIVFTLVSPWAHAEDVSSGKSTWKFHVIPYIWMAGISGHVTVKGSRSSVDDSFSDILENLDFAGFLHLEAAKGKWALILSEIAPDRADAILARGRAFGESRVVCNIHWHSDVVEGRFMGAAAVARLHAAPAFRAELEAAKAEVVAIRARGLKPSRDCDSEAKALAIRLHSLDGEAKNLQSWQGDYPVAQLKLLPEKQREQGVGFIDDGETFKTIWNVFKPGEDVPKIDFKAHLVLFARNTQFYDRISIGRVKVTNGVAEVLAMETMSAMPIEDKVGMSIVVVPPKGISLIQTGDNNVPVKKDVG